MKKLATTRKSGIKLWSGPIMRRAAVQSFIKLDPRKLYTNPVMLVVEVGAVISSIVLLQQAAGGNGFRFTLQIAVWLWFTVIFGNFAESLAEARGKAQADTLRATKKDSPARRVKGLGEEMVSSLSLRNGDVVIIKEGEVIPIDGEVVGGVAYVNEAAITGESAPVLKEPGTDTRSTVTGGTLVATGTLRVRATADPGSTFLDRMIAMVEGSSRRKTPNEIALTILLAGLTIVFTLVVVAIQPFAEYADAEVPLAILVALLVCLIPTTIGGLLSAVGIAGMDRLTRFNVLALSGRAIESAGDVDTLLLDKTGTITYGNRLAADIIPVGGGQKLAALIAARMSSLADETPEGKSLLALAEQMGAPTTPALSSTADVIKFDPRTRISGVVQDGRYYIKGAVDAVIDLSNERAPDDMQHHITRISSEGGTPLALAIDKRIVGVAYLKDTVKPGMRDRFDEFRKMGIKTIMLTGDNTLTAATIAREAGVDSYVAEAKPEDKIRVIKEQQRQGHMVAMTGDGTNDAPALAQADVGMAMNSGTAAAKEAANMVDLDSNPTKLIEVVSIGKQLLITRGAITTFSIANDVAKYFAIIPAAFAATYPALDQLDFMKLESPESAILSAVIFNALIIVALIPLALRGVGYRPAPASRLLARNLLIYGLGGLITPFLGMKVIDLLITALGLV
jgi:K+-transporting ATPase ATPase B chain